MLRTNAHNRRVPLAILTAVIVSATVTIFGQSGPALAAGTSTINGSTTFQTITGFGASEAFGQASTVMNASSPVQQQALNLLYGPTSGAGLTMLRNWISADSGSTIEPTSPGSPSATPTYLPMSSTGQDAGQLWFAQQIKSLYGVSNVFADAWSAPAFMKTNNSASNGGAVCGVPGATCSSGDWRQAYANYLVQYAKDYSAAGVPLSYIGPENEANLSTSYDSMQMSPSQTASFLDTLGPALSSSGLSTKMECCATEGWDFAQQYAAAIEADSTANANTAVFTSHGYTAAPTTPLSGWTKPAWETEWSTFESWDPAWDDGTQASGLTWAQHIYQGLTGSNLNAFLYWWGSTTPQENGDNEGLILINGSTVTPSGRLWAFANYSRYIHPGAARIAATNPDGNVTVSAYKNTDGTIAIVALNTASSSDSVGFTLQNTGVTTGTATPVLTNGSNNAATQSAIAVSGGAFSATLPPRSLVTYVVKGSGGGGNTVTVTSPGNQTATVAAAASLQIQASDSAAGQTLSYSATGLPAGLAINSSTGLISGTPTTAGTSAVTVAATDTTGASGSATFTWTVNPAGNGGFACRVVYATQSEWAGGFVAGITMTNTGTVPWGSWTLTFTFPGDQKITNGWNGTITQAGENVTITNAPYNATVSPGASTSLGFQGTWTTSDAPPASFKVNGTTCT